jgi:hypothetical protein
VAIEKSSTGWGTIIFYSKREKEVMEKRGGHLQLAVVLVFVGAFHVPNGLVNYRLDSQRFSPIMLIILQLFFLIFLFEFLGSIYI